jgi:hypothetical protein
MNEHQIRSADDLRARLILEDFMAQARKYAAEQRFAGKDKKVFMRACRKHAESQSGTKASG